MTNTLDTIFRFQATVRTNSSITEKHNSTVGYTPHRLADAINTYSANIWINDQLKTPHQTAQTLFFNIVKKYIDVPNKLSLHLVLNSLIKNRVAVNAPDSGGWTALYWASKNEQLEMTKLLIEHGANVNATSNGGWTALYWASKNEQLEMAQLLIEHGANVNTTNNDSFTPLYWASYNEQLEMAQLLIEHGADVNTTNNNEETPLYWASYNEQLEMAQLLIEHGADVNAKNNNGVTPLHFASIKGHLEMAKILIEYGADVNDKNNNEETPLIWASKNGHLDMAKLFIEKGADVNAADNNKDTPLIWASRYGYLELAQLLKIINHLDKNDTIDNLNSDIENVTTEQIKDYYNTNKDQIDSLMKHRKESQLALSIVHTPHNVFIPDNFDKEKIITYSLVLMKANKCLRYLPAFLSFPVKVNSQWKFIMPGFQFFSLQDLVNLAQANKEYYNIFSTQTERPSANNYLARLCNYLINHENGSQILINSNKRALTNQN